MSILAGAIIKKSGNVLLSRQYADFTKSRISLLLNNFTKLINENSQQTYVESGAVRYMYQPLGQLYVVLLTLKIGNIFEGSETLRLLADSIVLVCPNPEEKSVNCKKYMILTAFDEVVTMGYKEGMAAMQLKTVIEMDSIEERIQIAEVEALVKETSRQRTIHIREMKRQKKNLHANNDGLSAFSSKQAILPKVSGMYEAPVNNTQNTMTFDTQDKISKPKSISLGKSLKLHETKLGSRTQELFQLKTNRESALTGHEVSSEGNVAKKLAPVDFCILEKISCSMTTEGRCVHPCIIEGELIMNIHEPSFEVLQIHLGALTDDVTAQYSFMPRAQFDKAEFFANNMLSLKPNNKFPIDRDLPLLRWKTIKEKNIKMTPPVSVTCWIDEFEKTCDVTVECMFNFEVISEFHDLAIRIPIDPKTTPRKIDASFGTTHFDPSESFLTWEMPLIERSSTQDSNDNSGNYTISLNFEAARTNNNSFAPISLNFSSPMSMVEVKIEKVINLLDISDDSSPDSSDVSFSIKQKLTCGSYLFE